ncbi:oxidoreductase [Enterococcus durans]|uniref:phage antirepressor KilAC domain-containing protein n=1 Tax=Enterococcus durans TaxID=53345 RepID=UPI000F4E705D|nr:phage antirepressor KilAC domain-containing protein [Enterococcus durans]ROX83707.1 oxidoreductase [Enterococcus durans]
MKELIKVTTNENNEQLVSGRELHEFLEVNTPYKKWFDRMSDYGFVENIDFLVTDIFVPNSNGGKQYQIDHAMKLDMAKEISMIQRTEKGKQARQYFLQVEKAWNSEEMILMRSRQILERKVETLQLENEEMKPKALFADSVSASHTSILVGELAKLINQNGVDIGSKRLFSWLREKGYLIKRKGTDWNMPTQKAMDLGLFEIKETTISHSDGHISINKTPKVTGKGQVYFVNKFLGGAISEKTYFKTID